MPIGAQFSPQGGGSGGESGATSLVVTSTDNTIIQNGTSTYDTFAKQLSIDLSANLPSVLSFRGAYDASTNVFPSTGGSGTGGSIKAGDTYYINVAGTLGGKPVQVGNLIIANVNNPGQTSSNWLISNNIYTNSIPNSFLAQMPAFTIKGNNTNATANVADLTVAQVTSMIANTVPTSNIISEWDTNKNLSANNFFTASTNIVTSGGTTTLTVASSGIQLFTGTKNQTVILPNATTLINGISYTIINQSTGVISVQTNGGANLISISSGNSASVILTSNSNAAGIWNTLLNSAGVSTNYVYAALANNATIVNSSAGQDILFNSVNGTIPVNGSTGVFTLTAGQTYYLQSALGGSVTGTSVSADIYFVWSDATTNVALTNCAPAVVNYSRPDLMNTVTSLIYTPTTNQTVKVRIFDAIITGTSPVVTLYTPANSISGVWACSWASIVQIGATPFTILPIANGGTGNTSLITTPTANTIPAWDINKNLSANNFLTGFTSTPTASGTTTLTVSSTETQAFTGTNAQTVVLPNATTLVNGTQFNIINNSTGTITVQTNGGGGLTTISAGNSLIVSLISNTIAAGTWKYFTSTPTGGSNALPSANIFVGNASNVATAVNMTGDVNISNTGVTTIQANTVTNAKLAQAPSITLKGNNTGSTANPLDLSTSQVKTMLNIAFSDVSGTATITQGGTGATTQAAAITALTGTQTSGQYLRSNGTNALLSTIQAADVPTLNQNTTGTAAAITGGAANQLLLQSAANTTGFLATANNAVLVTNASGVPSFSTSLTLAGNIIPSTDNTFTVGNTSNAFANMYTYNLLSNGTNPLSVTSGSTGAITLDSGTTGTVNIGTGTGAKTVNIGTGGTGTKTIAIGTGAVANTITVGNATVSTAVNINAGTATAAANGTVTITTGTLAVAGTTTGGAITATGNITAFFTSDVRLKENIKPIQNALDKVAQIKGVTYDWTEEYINAHGGEDDYFIRKHDVGVIAQDIEKVLPEIVANRADGYKAVKYERICALLIEAIKELSSKIAILEKGE